MPSDVHAFCIGHLPPHFEPPWPYTMLCPKPLGIHGEWVIRDDRFGPDIDGAELAEYSQLFALQDMLEAGDVVADRLYLFQYRKFIGLRSGGQPATSPWLRIASPQEATALMPSFEQLIAVPYEVLVGSMHQLGMSVASNYALVHVIEDLVAFAGCLGEAGLDPQAIRRFAACRGLIPSPTLCLIDVPLFIRQMQVLRAAWQTYVRECAVTRQGYQRRVSGYLLERLQSHLLCDWLMDGSQSAVGLGHRFAVVDKLSAKPAQDSPLITVVQ